MNVIGSVIALVTPDLPPQKTLQICHQGKHPDGIFWKAVEVGNEAGLKVFFTGVIPNIWCMKLRFAKGDTSSMQVAKTVWENYIVQHLSNFVVLRDVFFH